MLNAETHCLCWKPSLLHGMAQGSAAAALMAQLRVSDNAYLST